MNNCFKYGLISLLVLLLHCVITQATQDTCTVSTDEQEACFNPQKGSIHYPESPFRLNNAICELRNAETSPLPTGKNLVRFTPRYRVYKSPVIPAIQEESLLPIYNSSDPIGYYVFGLRKIII